MLRRLMKAFRENYQTMEAFGKVAQNVKDRHKDLMLLNRRSWEILGAYYGEDQRTRAERGLPVEDFGMWLVDRVRETRAVRAVETDIEA